MLKNHHQRQQADDDEKGHDDASLEPTMRVVASFGPRVRLEPPGEPLQRGPALVLVVVVVERDVGNRLAVRRRVVHFARVGRRPRQHARERVLRLFDESRRRLVGRAAVVANDVVGGERLRRQQPGVRRRRRGRNVAVVEGVVRVVTNFPIGRRERAARGRYYPQRLFGPVDVGQNVPNVVRDRGRGVVRRKDAALARGARVAVRRGVRGQRRGVAVEAAEVEHVVAQQPYAVPVAELALAQFTDRVVITVLQPLQVGLNYAFGVVLKHAMLAYVHSVFETELVGDLLLRTLTQTHDNLLFPLPQSSLVI